MNDSEKLQKTSKFLDALFAMWKVNAQGWITQRLGPAQANLLTGNRAGTESRQD